MYTLGVIRDFIAQHYLIGGNWGPENEKHSHHYRLELRLEGESLNPHGYLVDIVEVEDQLEAFIATYRDRTLNDQPPFAGLNPSIEHFARIACQALAERLWASHITAITVTMWEDESAWASYRQQR